MQQARRGNVTSVDEPNAFRIAPAPRSFDAPISGPRDGHHFAADFPPNPLAAFSRAAGDFPQPYHHLTEPASWLAAPDLSSPTFSAHDFLQHALSQRFDKAARPTHIPVLENSFDADAALAALDTVESGLRKKRDIARREEELARDELRKSLHLSAKKREQLVRTAGTVSANVTSFSEIGRRSAEALNLDVTALKAAAQCLADLQDARDVVSLLTMDDCELDAVRVSKLLAKARQYFEDGSLFGLLPPDDMIVAREEFKRCEDELNYSIHAWMRNALDTGQHHIVRECAQAAEELNASQSFIHSYISHLFPGDQAENRLGIMQNEVDIKPIDDVELFRSACWETTDALGEVIPIICESFPQPARTLAAAIRVLSERKVTRAADITVKRRLERIYSGGNVLLENGSRSSSFASLTRSSVERISTVPSSEAKESWRENSARIAGQRREFLRVCAQVFKDMALLKSELLARCLIPGVEGVEKEFSKGSDPYLAFADRWFSEYQKAEKNWIDEQLATAFFDITRIEAHAPRLAPREASNADVYHRYRAFYCHISSQYQQMTRSAVESTYESLSRVASMIRSSSLLLTRDQQGEKVSSQLSGIHAVTGAGAIPSPAVKDVEAQSPLEAYTYEETECEGKRGPGLSHNESKMKEVKQLPSEVLDGLVMCYLANAETILQAATHLLPMSEDDAKMQELWVSGASPLTAYMQAIEVVSKSNELLDEFLLTLEVADHVSEVSGPTILNEDDVELYVPKETRDALHRELTSGLSDLGAEAQAGVRASVDSVRARLSAMLSGPAMRTAYSKESLSEECNGEGAGDEDNADIGLDIEPSSTFMSASTFVEQQLQSVLASIHGGNRDYVISELAKITKDTVLKCWCSCDGPVPFSGALQLVADGRAMARVFQSHEQAVAIVECLPSIGQLFLEGASGLWQCVESKSLASVEARTLVQLLKKREDRAAERVVKVCQSLGATSEDLGE